MTLFRPKADYVHDHDDDNVHVIIDVHVSVAVVGLQYVVSPKSLEKGGRISGARVWPRAKHSEALGSDANQRFKPVPPERDGRQMSQAR